MLLRVVLGGLGLSGILVGTRWCDAPPLNEHPLEVTQRECIAACGRTTSCNFTSWDQQRSYCYMFSQCDRVIDDFVALETRLVWKKW